MQGIRALCEKERERVKIALSALTVINQDAEEVMELINSYAADAEHFYSKNDFISAFELYVYIFGLLDALAILGLIDPGKARKHFKVEQ